MKIKFGALVVDGRGKIGGHVASKNASGAYLRTKVTPTNPSTVFQTVARVLFASISAGWSLLTAAQREGWNGAVQEWAKTDIFGDLKNPTGKALYQRLNNQAQSAGFPAVTDAPAKLELPQSVVEGVSFDQLTPELIVSRGAPVANARIMLFATPPLSQGTKFVKNRLRNFYNVVDNTFDNENAYAAYVARFGTPAIGNNIFVGVKYVLPNGQASPLQIIKADVQ